MPLIIEDRDLEQRVREIENAIASVRLEGLEPSMAAKALYARYVEGEISREELDRLFDEHLNRAYGPVRLPGN